VKTGVNTANRKRALLRRWYALWPVTAGLILYPVNNLPLRMAIVVCLALLWTGMLYFYWDRRIGRVITTLAAVAVIAFFLLPGRNCDRQDLRGRYVGSLLKYEGTRYIWGGENWVGIDCSGLVRSGLIRANYEQGILHFNPRLIREGFSLWWHDCSARALGEEYRGRTRLLASARSINKINYETILPGDIAVTEDGIHTLAYLGEKLWIEADPEVKKVIRVQAPATNPWFDQPVKVMRWVQFEGDMDASAP
jgi:hypothetical protein